LNSKERVKTAVNCQVPDHTPLGLYAVDHDIVASVIGRPSCVRNFIEFRIAMWEGRRDEIVARWTEDLIDFYRKIDCVDVITWRDAWVMPPAGPADASAKKIADDKWEDREGRIYQLSYSANEVKCIHDPTQQNDSLSVEDYADRTFVPPDPSQFEVIDAVIAEFGTERYFLGPGGHAKVMPKPGGFENAMMVYALQPEVIKACNQQMVDLGQLADEYFVRPGADAVSYVEDMAGSNAPFISPEMFKELCYPYLKQRIENYHKYSDQVIMHNCGRNLPYMEMLIECGMNCYQSLQTNAGMEIGFLKENFGGRISFWGGIPLENLISATPDVIRQDVRTALERGAPGGGFILGPSQSIAFGTKYDNFMAMLDEFVKLRDKY
jgi:uroporphyrinogen decarboxylase